MSKPKYWRGLEELNQTPEFLEEQKHEFPTDLPLEDTLSNTTDESLEFKSDRRDFLKIMGFGVTAATLSACAEAPLKKAIPYVEKPDDIIPGVANWYASTASTGMPILVKTREGRPIKLEGNPDSPLTHGGLDAVTHATLLELYDNERLKAPVKGGTPTSWSTLDSEVRQKLNEIKAVGGKVRILSGSVISPSTQKVIQDFIGDYANAAHISYDPVSYTAIGTAHLNNFGKRLVPSYYMEKAEVIVGFSCDFLGTWLNPTGFSAAYAMNRDPKAGKMSRHFQIESILSLTGSNADLRFPVKPSSEGLAVATLYNKVARKMGQPEIPGVPSFSVAMNGLDKIAEELTAARGKSLVMCGTNDVATQEVVNALNYMLGNYGSTIDLDNPCYLKQGDDEALTDLVNELNSVDALFVYGANPVYDTPYAEQIKSALGKMKLSVSLTSKKDETSALCQYTAPDSHYLESWSDARQCGNHFTLVQPAINTIYDTRQAQDSFLTWAGISGSYESRIQDYWKNTFYNTADNTTGFQAFWDETLRKGVITTQITPGTYELTGDIAAAGSKIAKGATSEDTLEVVFYEKVAMRNGEFANNPWLQELPDPISRTVWNNYLSVPKAYAETKGLKDDDLVTVSVGGNEMKLAVIVQVGQAMNTMAIALGYGRTEGGKVATIAGNGSADVNPLVQVQDGHRKYAMSGIEIGGKAGTFKIAKTQIFDYLYDAAKGEAGMGGDYDRTNHIIRETNLASYKKDPWAGNSVDGIKQSELKDHLISLWDFRFDDPKSKRHIRWAMSIDMNKCTGCGACVVSCHAENNVPVVGKQEVINRREMHWIRIDRYYSGDPGNPDVVFQPMLCQHCDNAPCETVCPVLATIHSAEGLNQMTYNRCVGTRYCANNCPYKVRRFNWFNYTNGEQFADINPSQTNLGRLVLNPDVTVRFRGVMEKCSFCVQRLQDGKLRAKLDAGTSVVKDENGHLMTVKPKDGSIKTACQQSCPTGAIQFGDLNDPNSEVSKAWRGTRTYHVIEQVKTLPSIAYQVKVRNRTDAEMEAKMQAKKDEQTYA